MIPEKVISITGEFHLGRRVSTLTIKEIDPRKVLADTCMTEIFQKIAPSAILSTLPTCIEFNAHEVHTTVVDYTDNQAINNVEQIFLIGNHYEPRFCSYKKATWIAYHIINRPEILCLEGDGKGRSFFRIDRHDAKLKNLNYYYLYEDKLNSALYARNFLKEQSFNELDKDHPENQKITRILNEVPSEAVIHNNSTVSFLKNGMCHQTILNQTSHHIAFDIEHELCINGQKVLSIKGDPTHVVTYHPAFHPEIICIDYSYCAGNRRKEYAFNRQGIWELIFVNIGEIYFQDAAIKKVAAFILWKGFWDPSSFFSDISIPFEVLQLIINSFVSIPPNLSATNEINEIMG